MPARHPIAKHPRLVPNTSPVPCRGRLRCLPAGCSAVYNFAVHGEPKSQLTISRLYPVRSTLRISEFDYATPGAYFVTICTFRKACLFGQVTDDRVSLSAAGSMVAETWSQLPQHYPAIRTDAFVVMPNHIHGVLFLADEHLRRPHHEGGQAWEPAPTSEHLAAPPVNSESAPALGLSDVVHRFKTLTTHRFSKLAHDRSLRPTYRHMWQRNYYEHVIRNEDSLQRIREYITNNPVSWAVDRENPTTVSGPATITDPWQV